MKEGPIERDVSSIPNDRSSEAADPRNGAFDFPTLAIPSELSSILGFGSFSSFAMRANKLHAPFFELLKKGIAIVARVGNKTFRRLLVCRVRSSAREWWPAFHGPGLLAPGMPRQGCLPKEHFCRRPPASRGWISSVSFWRKTGSSQTATELNGPYASAYSGANEATEHKARNETDGSNESSFSNRFADPVPYLCSQNSSGPSILNFKEQLPDLS